ncbi:hypothetical protein [Luteolibacter sp. Populi]|uniref:hypothetical protein n=1 Tax=Luteolibacter sp. Populi TaxID=3230487 RepID=UPI003465D281
MSVPQLQGVPLQTITGTGNWEVTAASPSAGNLTHLPIPPPTSRSPRYATVTASGAAADLEENGTGVSNLFRYAFNMTRNDPYRNVVQSAGTTGLPALVGWTESGLMRIGFMRRKADRAPGISYTVQFGDLPGAWEAVGHQVGLIDFDEDFEYVIWEDEGGPYPHRFGRVKVE